MRSSSKACGSMAFSEPDCNRVPNPNSEYPIKPNPITDTVMDNPAIIKQQMQWLENICNSIFSIPANKTKPANENAIPILSYNF